MGGRGGVSKKGREVVVVVHALVGRSSAVDGRLLSVCLSLSPSNFVCMCVCVIGSVQGAKTTLSTGRSITS